MEISEMTELNANKAARKILEVKELQKMSLKFWAKLCTNSYFIVKLHMFRGNPGSIAKKQIETNEVSILKRHNYTRFKTGEFAAFFIKCILQCVYSRIAQR